ncbi:MAG: TonB-dependent receptor [Bacteroidota bacterium]
MVRLLLALALCALCLGPGAEAQRAVLSGAVVDAEDGQALAGVNVVLERQDGQTFGRATGRDGGFAFGGLLPGRYALAATFLGYDAFADTLALAFGDRVTLEIALAPAETAMETVTVETERTTTTSAPAGLVQLRPADLAVIPAPDLSGDLAGVLTVQPGIATIGDRGGQLYIRGGTPTQNLVLVDGMRLFQPFHIVGFYSAFPAEIVQQADVYAGGFGARYGGRISSVIDVQTKNGSKQRFGGSASLAPFLTSVRVEGPIVPDEASFVLSVRESVVERVAEQVVGEALPYRFGDAFGKVHFFTGPASFVSLTGLRTTDAGTISGVADQTRIDWTNEALGGRFFYLPPSVAAALDVTVNYAAYRSSFEPDRAPARDADVRSFGGQFALAYYLGRAEVHFGFGGQTLLFDYTFDRAGPTQRERTTEGTFFVEAEFDLGRGVRVEPGLRLQTFPAQQRDLSLEPRLRASWAASPGLTLSTALGLYRQEIIGLSDERDIGDVFTAWASIPQNEPTPRALHAILGAEVRPTASLALGVEGYAKQLDAMQVLLADRGLVRSNGEVFGVDLRAEWGRRPLTLLATYGYSASTYRNAREAYRPPHDRRHRLNLVGTFERGPWRLAARWQLASGRPFTRLVGVFDDLGAPDPAGEFLTAEGTPAVIPEAVPFRGLTPSYHRLDVSAERDFDLGPALLTLQASVINTTDRANFFYYDALRADRVDQFPLIPSVGLRVAFE